MESFPFSKLPHAYIRQGLLKDGGPTKFAVYGAHLSVSPGDWSEYNLKVSKIMELTGLGRTSVTDANKWLREKKVIDSAVRIYGSGQKANEWLLLPPSAWADGGCPPERIGGIRDEAPPVAASTDTLNSNNNLPITRTFKKTTTVEIEIPKDVDPVVVALFNEFEIDKGRWGDFLEFPLQRLQEAALYTRKNAKTNPGGLFCRFLDNEWKSKTDSDELWVGECDRIRAQHSHLQSKDSQKAYPIIKTSKGPQIVLDTHDGPYYVKTEEELLKFLQIVLPIEEHGKVVNLK